MIPILIFFEVYQRQSKSEDLGTAGVFK